MERILTVVRPYFMPKKRKYDRKQAVRKLARERVGTVPASKVIQPKAEREKPKHKQPAGDEDG